MRERERGGIGGIGRVEVWALREREREGRIRKMRRMTMKIMMD